MIINIRPKRLLQKLLQSNSMLKKTSSKQKYIRNGKIQMYYGQMQLKRMKALEPQKCTQNLQMKAIYHMKSQ